MNRLESLKRYTTVVADTGDIEAIAVHKPQDATTNPSLLLQAAQKPQYQHLVDEALDFALASPGDEAAHAQASMDKLFVGFGCQILQVVPGRVSTEVDAGLSFDTEATLAKARRLTELYRKAGVGRERSAHQDRQHLGGHPSRRTTGAGRNPLQSDAVVQLCPGHRLAEAGVTLISPFVGRIYDWYKKENGGKDIPADQDPGVASVTKIYNYFKKFGFKTQVIGASFRKVDQIVRLAGCDLLTISPDLLAQMEKADGSVSRCLSPEEAKASDEKKIDMNEKTFRWMHNEDAMATDKLAEGIRKFYAERASWSSTPSLAWPRRRPADNVNHTKEAKMQLGMIGLGRMGANMVRRLLKGGHQCVVFDRSPDAVKQLVGRKRSGLLRSRSSRKNWTNRGPFG